MSMVLVDIILGFIIGLTLGLLGGGGSILTVPALVYIVGQTPQVAVTASLMIVGANSAMGAFLYRSQGSLNWRVALVFGGVGMLMAYLSAGLSKQISPELLMILFSLLMLSVGGFMIFRQPPAESIYRGLPATVISGAVVGILTGFLGVGGGFLIVPALVLLVGLPMRQAVGTSLVVITMNSLAGFLGHLDAISLDFVVIGLFVVSGFVGAFVGAHLTKYIKPNQLRQMFAVFVIALGLFLLYDNLGQLL